MSCSNLESYLETRKPPLWSIQSITSVPRARHGALDIDGIRIDHELPADALTLREHPMCPSFIVVGLGRESASTIAADGENVFPQGNLDIAIADVWHFDGKQETRLVFLYCDAVVVLVFLKKAVCWR